ncbi:MAG: HD-GYP domain-containing protein [Acidobacteria bacterium]|nr:HD-GYP domain-containing protein [Acidobacteriota bacterium]
MLRESPVDERGEVSAVAALLRGSRDAIRAPSPEPLRVKELDEQLRQMRAATVCALNQMLDLKDLNTGVHSTRLAEWAMRVAEQLGVAEHDLRDIEVAAILHDIGKVGVPDSILNKPGKLTPEERAVIEKHSEYGWAILRLIPGFERASLLVLHHHERTDGKGYPARLKGEEIPLGARIVSVVDAFDAMVSNRSYRQGLPAEEAMRRLRADSGTQFDATIVERFVQLAVQELPEISQIVAPAGLAAPLSPEQT